MWGGEITLRLFLDAVAFIDGLGEVWQREQEQLRARGAFLATGVGGGFATVMPGYQDDGAVASVYADIAWRRGWLSVDRTLSDRDDRGLREDVIRWCARDRDLDQVLTDLGTPSVWFGGSNPRYPKTLAYATGDRGRNLLCLHFDSTYDWDASPPEASSPLLVAVRHGEGGFADSFTFTPAGLAYRHDAEPPPPGG
jgi:hypothetical protein